MLTLFNRLDLVWQLATFLTKNIDSNRGKSLHRLNADYNTTVPIEHSKQTIASTQSVFEESNTIGSNLKSKLFNALGIM